MNWTAIFLALASMALGAVLMRQYLQNRKISLQSVWAGLQREGSPVPCADSLSFSARTLPKKGLLTPAHSPSLSFLYVNIPREGETPEEEFLLVSQSGFVGQLKLTYRNGELLEAKVVVGTEKPQKLKIALYASIAVRVLSSVRGRQH
ncbi:hypothetical protein COU78_06835 [Candidatus Peregrinibacteria bacterium CG10_big_fil_rev_8_21_14_0_10_49_24]|nr:MAG: hypothetical protein COV83_02125 [Candidatus Peregrinibacteria bacterium CG11_big_fil_rev_8_21_14_0_20_49_14]PIR50404.1 MAG: hypothetical protein COU78_06835 [Candidatus Peregrinibacteria bacterium CG10_big_fil_rev_8_21_14_0_10_49_24]PJA67493.1 MAG: hypothetical protein CO157_03625 [Candidatus Peregrinibacteria bacterium CG_4_9_14_3_um_filter_49_12]